jgi:hypothetical protein
MKARNLLAERADHSSPVGDAVVHERDDLTPKMMEKLAEEYRDFILTGIVPEEQSVYAEAVPRGQCGQRGLFLQAESRMDGWFFTSADFRGAVTFGGSCDYVRQ